MAVTQVPTNKILDGTLKDADIAADAAIIVSKLASSASTILGSKSSGGVVALTPSEAVTILSLRPFGVVTLTDGSTPALNASLGDVFTLSAAGDRTIAIPSNPSSGQKIVIIHYASGGSRTLALNSGTGGFRFGSDITALTATGSGKKDYIGCIYNAGDNKWDVVGYSKGF